MMIVFLSHHFGLLQLLGVCHVLGADLAELVDAFRFGYNQGGCSVGLDKENW